MDSLDEETAAEVLGELDNRLKAQIVEKMDPEKAADILEEMPPDEAADLLADLSPETSRELLQEMPREDAQEVRDLLKFEADTAGGIMTTEFVVVSEDTTRGEVVDYIRFHEVPIDQLDNVFVINKDAVLVGAVPVPRLLLAGPDQAMNELYSEPPVSARPETDDNEIFEQFDKYNLRSMAVVDEGGRPIGAIAVDDVVMRLRQKL